MRLYPKPELETDVTEAGYVFTDLVGAEADLTVSWRGVVIDTSASGDVFFSLEELRELFDLVKSAGSEGM